MQYVDKVLPTLRSHKLVSPEEEIVIRTYLESGDYYA